MLSPSLSRETSTAIFWFFSMAIINEGFWHIVHGLDHFSVFCVIGTMLWSMWTDPLGGLLGRMMWLIMRGGKGKSYCNIIKYIGSFTTINNHKDEGLR